MSDFYTTRVTLEVDVDHQFDFADAARIVTDNLNFPAVKKIRVIKAENVCHYTPDAKQRLSEDRETLTDFMC